MIYSTMDKDDLLKKMMDYDFIDSNSGYGQSTNSNTTKMIFV